MSPTPAPGKRNETVALLRAATTPARKRGGARYGPAPEHAPHPGMQAPTPMDPMRRYDVHGGLVAATRRQVWQWIRMAELHGVVERVLDDDSKGQPTPRRGSR